MSEEFNHVVIDEFMHLYDDGYRCINYEINEEDRLFTAYLKNFEMEDTKILKCGIKEGAVLKSYIDGLS